MMALIGRLSLKSRTIWLIFPWQKGSKNHFWIEASKPPYNFGLQEVSMEITLKDILHDRVCALLHLETEAGLGCTDPAAIGLAAAAALLDN
jgi:hypothetical protein